MTTRTRSKKSDTNGDAESLEIPDALGTTGRVQTLARKLYELQQQSFEIDLIQDANDHGNDDELPGGGGKSYNDRRAELATAEKRLINANPKLVEQVKGYLMALTEGRTP